MDQPAPVSHTNDMYCMGRQAPSASSPAEELLKAVKFTCQLNYSAHAADASRPGSQALGWLPDRNAGRIFCSAFRTGRSTHGSRRARPHPGQAVMSHA